MRALALLCALCMLGAAVAAAAVNGAGAANRSSASAAIGDPLIASIEHYRKVTWHWQQAMGRTPTRADDSARRSPDPAYLRWVLRLWARRARRVQHIAGAWLARHAAGYRQVVRHWQRVMGTAAPTREPASAGVGGLATLERETSLWRERAQAVLRRAQHPPNEQAFRCIHRFEGSWTDGGGPYYGGLQMDLGFQSRYGPYLLRTKGTADHWTPLEQIWVAEKAWRSGRGFWPWPNTARICGLL